MKKSRKICQIVIPEYENRIEKYFAEQYKNQGARGILTKTFMQHQQKK